MDETELPDLEEGIARDGDTAWRDVGGGQSAASRSPLASLPFGVAEHICTFLGARDLVNLSVAAGPSRQLRSGIGTACTTRAVWASRIRNDFLGRVQVPAVGGPPAKQVYLQTQNEDYAQRVLDAANREAEWRRQLRQASLRKFRVLFDLFQVGGVSCCSGPLLLAGAVLVSTALDSGRQLGWGDVAPFAAVLGVWVVATLCMCYVRLSSDPFPFDSDIFDYSNSFLKYVLRYMVDDELDTAGHARACAAFVPLATQWLFVLLRVTATVDWSWSVVLAPFWVFGCGLLVFQPGVGRWSPVVLLPWVCLFGPLLVLCGLLIAHLDSGRFTMFEVLSPLFALVGLALVGTIMAAYENDEWKAFFLSLAFFASAVGPLVAFFVMVAVYVESGETARDLSWTKVFSPLLAWLSMWSCAGFLHGFMVIDEQG